MKNLPPKDTLEIPAKAAKSSIFKQALAIAICNLCLFIFTLSPLSKSLGKQSAVSSRLVPVHLIS